MKNSVCKLHLHIAIYYTVSYMLYAPLAMQLGVGTVGRISGPQPTSDTFQLISPEGSESCARSQQRVHAPPLQPAVAAGAHLTRPKHAHDASPCLRQGAAG